MNIGAVINSIAQIPAHDHHLLTGLGDDDHTQYLNSTRLQDYIARTKKAVDETVNNSAVLQNDDDFLFAIAANEARVVHLYLIQSSPSANSDFKVGFAYPAGCTIRWAAVYQAISGTPWTGGTSAVSPTAIQIESATYIFGSAAVTQGIFLILLVRNGGTAGNFQFQWAQGTATVENTVLNKESQMLAIKMA